MLLDYCLTIVVVSNLQWQTALNEFTHMLMSSWGKHQVLKGWCQEMLLVDTKQNSAYLGSLM